MASKAPENDSVKNVQSKRTSLPVDRPTTSSLKKKTNAVLPIDSSPKRKAKDGTPVARSNKKQVDRDVKPLKKPETIAAEVYASDDFEAISRQNSQSEFTSGVELLMASGKFEAGPSVVIKPKNLTDFSLVNSYLAENDFEEYNSEGESNQENFKPVILQSSDVSKRRTNPEVRGEVRGVVKKLGLSKSYSDEAFDSYDEDSGTDELHRLHSFSEYQPNIISQLKKRTPVIGSQVQSLKPSMLDLRQTDADTEKGHSSSRKARDESLALEATPLQSGQQSAKVSLNFKPNGTLEARSSGRNRDELGSQLYEDDFEVENSESEGDMASYTLPQVAAAKFSKPQDRSSLEPQSNSAENFSGELQSRLEGSQGLWPSSGKQHDTQAFCEKLNLETECWVPVSPVKPGSSKAQAQGSSTLEEVDFVGKELDVSRDRMKSECRPLLSSGEEVLFGAAQHKVEASTEISEEPFVTANVSQTGAALLAPTARYPPTLSLSKYIELISVEPSVTRENRSLTSKDDRQELRALLERARSSYGLASEDPLPAKLREFLRDKGLLIDEILGQAEPLKASRESIGVQHRVLRRRSVPNNKFFLSFSEGMEELMGKFRLFAGRRIVSIFSANSSMLAIAFSASTVQNSKDSIANRGIIAMLTTNAESGRHEVAKVLSCPDRSVSCCAVDRTGRFAAAGTENAGMVVWDLENYRLVSGHYECAQHRAQTTSSRGSSGNSRAPIPTAFRDSDAQGEAGLVSVPVMQPTFTSFKFGVEQGTHTDAIDSLFFLKAHSGSRLKEVNVVSVDRSGVACVWGIREQVLTSGETELKTAERLAFDSLVRVQLKWASHLAQEQRQLLGGCDDAGAFASDWQLTKSVFYPYLPRVPLILLSSGMGFTLHDVFRGKDIRAISAGALPVKLCNVFRLPLDQPNQLTFLSTSPFDPRLFLAGFSSGVAALYSILSSVPLQLWQVDQDCGIRQIEWSPQRPAVFFCLTTSGKLVMHDLLANRIVPQISQSLNNYREQIGTLEHFTLSLPAVCKDQTEPVKEPSLQTPLSTERWRDVASRSSGLLLLAFSTGVLESHQLDEQWVTFQDTEETYFQRYF